MTGDKVNVVLPVTTWGTSAMTAPRKGTPETVTSGTKGVPRRYLELVVYFNFLIFFNELCKFYILHVGHMCYVWYLLGNNDRVMFVLFPREYISTSTVTGTHLYSSVKRKQKGHKYHGQHLNPHSDDSAIRT